MKKGIALIMLANLINLAIGLVNGFVLPRFLSVESYAMIKTFTLYSTFAGIFHLGYLDGMYLKYGGRDMMTVSSKEYGTDFWNVTIMQLILSVVLLFVGYLYDDFVLSAFAISLLLINLISCFQMFFQATGEFKLYSSALNYGTILSLIISLALVFLIKTEDAKLYISAQLFSSLVAVIYIGLLLNGKIHFLRKQNISMAAFKENINSGFVLMIGNFSNNLFTSIDRWLVKILMTTFSFAAYSFAISIDALITVFITPLFVILYNAFCKDQSADRVLNIKRLVLMWGFIIVLLAFPAKWFVENYMDKYNASIPLIFILFCTQVFYAVIKGVNVNYFKALKMQKQYFRQIMVMLIVAVIFSLLLYLIFKTMMSLAVAGLLTAVVWLLVNEIRFKELRFKWNDWIYLSTLLVIYIISGLYLPSILGFFVYLISLIALSSIFMRQQTNMLLEILKSKIIRLLHK